MLILARLAVALAVWTSTSAPPADLLDPFAPEHQRAHGAVRVPAPDLLDPFGQPALASIDGSELPSDLIDPFGPRSGDGSRRLEKPCPGGPGPQPANCHRIVAPGLRDPFQ